MIGQFERCELTISNRGFHILIFKNARVRRKRVYDHFGLMVFSCRHLASIPKIMKSVNYSAVQMNIVPLGGRKILPNDQPVNQWLTIVAYASFRFGLRDIEHK